MLSVIIPTLNEAKRIGGLIQAIAKTEIAGEIIVVDADSTDGTADVASAAGARTIVETAGRGGQLDAGAMAAAGSWYLFLHADTKLGPGWSTVVARFMAESANTFKAGYFQYALDDPAPAARRLEAIVRWRCALLNLPYGDQGLLINAQYYDRLGGFKPIPLMEDVDLVRRIPRHRLLQLSAQMITSAARYRREGYVARPLRNMLCLSLYFLGVSPHNLVDFYR